jgi:5-methylcytosine-specific restriction endonuclease McrA
MPLTRHHIIPRSSGGGWEPENITLVCRPCHDDLDAAVGVGKKLPLPPEHHRKMKRAAEKRRKQRRWSETGVNKRKRPAICLECGNGISKARRAAGATLCQKHEWAAGDRQWQEAYARMQESLKASRVA